MKKICALVLCVLLLAGMLCLPVSAASRAIETIFAKVEEQVDEFADQFAYQAVTGIPTQVSPLLLFSLEVESDGSIHPIEDVADCRIGEENGEEALTIIPKQAEYATAVLLSLRRDLPLCTVTEETDSRTGNPYFNVFLPELTRDLYETARKYLESMCAMARNKIELSRVQNKSKILAAGGGGEEIKELDRIVDDALHSVDQTYENNMAALEKRYDAYCKTHPGESVAKLASSLSEGNPALIMGMIGLAVGMTVMFFIMKKKRRTDR